MRRSIPLALAALAALALSGCPRTPEAPGPGTGTPCEQLDDCNAGATCGALRLCVSGFCEAGRSLVRPCPGAGDPIAPRP